MFGGVYFVDLLILCDFEIWYQFGGDLVYVQVQCILVIGVMQVDEIVVGFFWFCECYYVVVGCIDWCVGWGCEIGVFVYFDEVEDWMVMYFEF